jgi:Leucine-rich repeat (LRR) protein
MDDTWSVTNSCFWLDLSNNQIEGSVSPAIADLTLLTSLSLNSNRMSGAITLKSWPSIERLYLYHNRFSSIEFTGSFPRLNVLSMLGSNLTSIDVTALTNLSDITLSSNQLKTWPVGLGATARRLDLFNNELEGTIPANLVPDFKQLREFTVGFNRKLKGRVPTLDQDIDQCVFLSTCLLCDGVPAKCACYFNPYDCSGAAAVTIVPSMFSLLLLAVGVRLIA